MTKWEMCCIFFAPGELKRKENIEKCCANCVYWHTYDEHLVRDENG